MDIYYLLMVVICCMFKNIVGLDLAADARKDADTCCDKLENSSFSTDCQQTMLWAGEHEKYAYTPGFPNQFPIKKLCSWGIYTKPGKRIRLEFRDFYLIGPGDDGLCYSQGVVIKSPLSGLDMGPHCGNAGLPSVVSAGNHLVVELISNIPMTSENYRGFKMAFVETVETPSPQLRPPNWGNDIVLTADPAVVQKLFVSPTVASGGPIGIKKAKTTKPPRFKPGRKLDTLAVYPAGPRRNSVYHKRPTSKPPVRRYPQATQSPTEETALALEHIVGIAVGSIVLVGIIILLIITIRYRRGKRKNIAEAKEKNEGKMDEINITELENKESHTNSNPETPNTSSPPAYYVYYYHDNEKNKNNEKADGKQKDTQKSSRARKIVPNRSGKHHRLRKLRTISITKPRKTTKEHRRSRNAETSRHKNHSTKQISERTEKRKKTTNQKHTNTDSKQPSSNVKQNGTSSSKEKVGPKEYKLLPPEKTTKVPRNNNKRHEKSKNNKVVKSDKSSTPADSKRTVKRKSERTSKSNTTRTKQSRSSKNSSHRRH